MSGVLFSSQIGFRLCSDQFRLKRTSTLCNLVATYLWLINNEAVIDRCFICDKSPISCKVIFKRALIIGWWVCIMSLTYLRITSFCRKYSQPMIYYYNCNSYHYIYMKFASHHFWEFLSFSFCVWPVKWSDLTLPNTLLFIKSIVLQIMLCGECQQMHYVLICGRNLILKAIFKFNLVV